MLEVSGNGVMDDYEELILARQDAQEIAEDNGPEKDIHRCVECVYYKGYNIKKNPCFPEIYFTGYCKIHDKIFIRNL